MSQPTNLLVNVESIIEYESAVSKNIFTKLDHQIVRESLRNLSGREYEVVKLRFWNDNTLLEISEILGLAVDEVRLSLMQALLILYKACTSQPQFSRFKPKKESDAQESMNLSDFTNRRSSKQAA